VTRGHVFSCSVAAVGRADLHAFNALVVAQAEIATAGSRTCSSSRPGWDELPLGQDLAHKHSVISAVFRLTAKNLFRFSAADYYVLAPSSGRGEFGKNKVQRALLH
jgi:hypothetical protein